MRSVTPENGVPVMSISRNSPIIASDRPGTEPAWSARLDTSLVYGVMLTTVGVATGTGLPSTSAGRYRFAFSTVPSLMVIGTSQVMWMFGNCCGPSWVAAHAWPAAPPSGPVGSGAAVAPEPRNGRNRAAARPATVTRNALLIASGPPLL
ncbi:Uncharacterised protein [Mycobacteroides abscessus subsp. abscessus]|nr:Uncharacterised protein [Mycobacteroides abscessus subsp. abscessus]